MRARTHGVWIAALALVIGVVAAPLAIGQGANRGYDISCNGTSIRFEGPTQMHEGEEHPDYGASFVVQGYIYPEGTFDEHGTDSGVDADGRAQFPELVVGTWYCRGWFVGPEGIFTPSGPLVVTNQVYDLDNDQPGTHTLMSDGVELADFNLAFRRAVTGGSGALAGARGEVIQTVVGVNDTGLFNFSFDFSELTFSE